MKLKESEISFTVEDKSYGFKVYHNLPEQFGLSMEGALDNWVVRTKKYTAKSLCDYVMSKGNEIVCMTERQFKRISHLGT